MARKRRRESPRHIFQKMKAPQNPRNAGKQRILSFYQRNERRGYGGGGGILHKKRGSTREGGKHANAHASHKIVSKRLPQIVVNSFRGLQMGRAYLWAFKAPYLLTKPLPLPSTKPKIGKEKKGKN